MLESCNGKINKTRYVMQHRRVEVESVKHNYYNSSMKPKFHKNTRLVGKIIEKNLSSKLLFKNTHNINNLSIKSIYRNKISPTPFRKRNNKPTSTRERKSNLTRKRKIIKILIQLEKRKQHKILKYFILP